MAAATHLARALVGPASVTELWRLTFEHKGFERPRAEFWANHAVTVARTLCPATSRPVRIRFRQPKRPTLARPLAAAWSASVAWSGARSAETGTAPE